jgi:Nucleotidyltransferase of unknown function (DUF6036)
VSVDAVDSAVLAVLAAVAPVLRHSGSRWYLFGAQAVTVWGRPRLSADVDLTAVIAGPHDDFVAAMLHAGFDLRISDWRDFVARTRVLPLLHRATQMPLDVVIAGPGLEEEFLERAVVIHLAGMDVPVITPEDLIVTKLLAGRPKDFEDVRGILEERLQSLDLVRLRSLLGLLEEALSRGDLTPDFERLLAAARDS